MWFEIEEDGEWKPIFAVEMHPYTHLNEVPYPDDPCGDGDIQDLAVYAISTLSLARGKGKDILLMQGWDESDSKAEISRTRMLTLRVDGQIQKESVWTSEGKPGPLDHMRSNPELSALLEALGLSSGN